VGPCYQSFGYRTKTEIRTLGFKNTGGFRISTYNLYDKELN